MKFTVKTLNTMNALKNHKENEECYCEETQKSYRWNGNEWEEIEPSKISMNLYEMNKNIISQLPEIKLEDIDKDIFRNVLIENCDHYMLLSREYGYYTVFEYGGPFDYICDTFENEVYDIITHIGTVHSLEEKDDGAIEFWIKPNGEEEVFVFYLFPYEQGVVYYG